MFWAGYARIGIMSYSLVKMNKEAIQGIQEEWFAQLEHLGEEGAAFGSSVERIVDWCEKAISGDDDTAPCLWALNQEGRSAPHAIVEMTDASRSKDPAFKFLNVELEPRLILDYKEEIRKSDLMETVKIISFALVEALKLALNNGTRKLKIYGRTDEMRSIFDSLILTIDPKSNDFNIYRQSKWLVIEEATR